MIWGEVGEKESTRDEANDREREEIRGKQRMSGLGEQTPDKEAITHIGEELKVTLTVIPASKPAEG